MTRPFIIELNVARAGDKLAAHGLSEDDAVEVWLGEPRFFRDKVEGRTMMIGPGLGGSLLTVVIAPTDQPGVWIVVTGWVSSKGEESRWRQAR